MKFCIPSEELKEEAGAETMRDEPTANPVPCPLHCSCRGHREFRSEDEPRKMGTMEEDCFKIWVYSSLAYSHLIGNKLK